jgi:hypothetical protein
MAYLLYMRIELYWIVRDIHVFVYVMSYENAMFIRASCVLPV